MPATVITQGERKDFRIPVNAGGIIDVQVPVARCTRPVELSLLPPPGTKLPAGVPFRLFHKRKFVTEHLSSLRTAQRRLKALTNNFTANEPAVSFHDLWDPNLTSLDLCWSLKHLDQDISRRNEQNLGMIARLISSYPSITLHLHAVFGMSSVQVPSDLAAALSLQSDAALDDQYAAIAQARADACANLLEEMGVVGNFLFQCFP